MIMGPEQWFMDGMDVTDSWQSYSDLSMFVVGMDRFMMLGAFTLGQIKKRRGSCNGLPQR
jgi:hypothetical protein